MKQRNIILSLVVGLLIISGIFFSGIFSIIGVGDIGNEVCTFNETNKECTIQVEVPENRALSLYTFDLDFESVPEAEFKGLTTITPFASGSYTEEDDKDLTFSLEERVYYKLYLYRLPDMYNTPYELRTTAEMFGASVYVTSDSAWSGVTLETGFFYEDYPYTTIDVCNEDSTRDCDNDYYLVQIYDNSRGEQQVNFAGDVRASQIYIPDRDNDISSGSIDDPEGFDLIYKGTNLVNTIPFPHENLAIYSLVELEDEEQNYAFQVWSEPTMMVEYKEAIFPSNVGYGLNNKIFDTFEGEGVAGEIKTSLDISNQINDFCGRNDNSTGACVFELTITSDTIGKVIVVDETLTLAYAEGDTDCATKGGCVVEELVVEKETIFTKMDTYVNFDFTKGGRDINTLTTYLVTLALVGGIVAFLRRKTK